MLLNGMYGNAVSWSQLAVKAVVGASSITLRDEVGSWPVGGTIAIASTDFDMNQAETRVITAVHRSKWGGQEGGRKDEFPGTFSECPSRKWLFDSSKVTCVLPSSPSFRSRAFQPSPVIHALGRC